MAKKVDEIVSEAKKTLQEQTSNEWEAKLSKMGSGKPSNTIKEEDEKEDDESEKEEVKEEKQENEDSEEVKEEKEVKISTDDDSKEDDNKKKEESFDVSKTLNIKEDIDAMFNGVELSEEYKTKISTVYEAAIKKSIQEAVKQIQEDSNKVIEEQVKKVEEKLEEQTNDFLNYVVEEWLSENQVAVETGIRAELAESMLMDLKKLVETYNVTIPQEKVDLLEEKSKETEELKAQINALTEKVIENEKNLFEMKKNETFAALTEGLADTEVEKFKTLVKDIDASDLVSFKEKAGIIKESYFNKVQATKETDEKVEKTEVLTEEVDSSMERYFTALQKLNATY